MSIRKTQKEFENEVFELCGNEYSVLGKYINGETKIEMKHIKCGNIYDVRPLSFISNGRRCPKCANKIRKKNLQTVDRTNLTTKQFEEKLHSDFGNEYKVLSEYENRNKKIKILHTACGTTFYKKPSIIVQGSLCPNCSKLNIGLEEIKNKILECENGNEYEVIGTPQNANNIVLKHLPCGNEYTIRLRSFINLGNRCQFCCNRTNSKGMKRIRNWLIKEQIVFQEQFKDSRCKNKKELPFDFYIELEDKYFCLIEYDGEQHFSPRFGYNKEDRVKNFEISKINDKIKDDFCNKYEIELIRISFEEIDIIDEKLTERFK